MNWTTSEIITSIVAVCALLLSIANFILARIVTVRDQVRQKREDLLHADDLLDTSFNMLYGPTGFTKNRDPRKLQNAEIAVERALKINPEYPRAIEYDGDLQNVHGNKDAAATRYKRSILLDPTRARPHISLGLISEDREAICHYERAIVLEPEKAALPYCNLGLTYNRLGEIGKAEECFLSAIKLRPKYQDAIHEFGKILQKRDDFGRARSAFENAIAADPNRVGPMVSLGQMLTQNLKNEVEGFAWIEQAIKVDPTNDYPLAMLAAIYADRGDAEKALLYAKKSEVINPERKFPTDNIAEMSKEMRRLLDERETNQET